MIRLLFAAALLSMARGAEVPEGMLCDEVFMLMEQANQQFNVEASNDPEEHPLVDAILEKYGVDGCVSEEGFGELWQDLNMTGDSSVVFDFINGDANDCINLTEMKHVAELCMKMLPF